VDEKRERPTDRSTARNGVLVGELTPLRRRRFVPAQDAIALFGTAPALDYDRFREDLDAVADQDGTPRA